MSFADLKKNRDNKLNKIRERIEEQNKGEGYEKDPTYWRLSKDKDGNGSAVIRFLPAPEGEDSEWVRYWIHQFRGPGGYYNNRCLTTWKENDPVADFNNIEWKKETEAAQSGCRDRKRKLIYCTNILVIKDPKAPENEGKVFRFEFGQKIFDKLQALMAPSDDDETPVDVFDFWAGANFRIKAKKVDKFPNYDDSRFDAPSPLFGGDDAKLKVVYGNLHPLKILLDREQYPTYEKLQEQFERVMGWKIPANGASTGRNAANVKAARASAPVSNDDDESPFPVSEDDMSGDEGSDDQLEYLRKLAEDAA